jgi:taurine dioxygenase
MVEIRKLGSKIGVEAVGVDVRTLDDAGFRPIYRAWLDGNVLVVRGQQLTIEQFLAWSRRFGRLEPHITRKSRHPDHPELTVMDNKAADAQGVSTQVVYTRGLGWHTDLTFEKVTAKATQLYSIAIPSRGGDTLFANMYSAYDALPARLKDRIADLKGAYLYGGKVGRSIELLDPADRARPPVLHALVRVHPETGRKALYIDPLKIVGIDGLGEADADALVEELKTYMVQPGCDYRHQWQVGDLVLWDNRCSIHSATGDYPPEERRALWRTTIMDPALAANRVAAE